MTLKKQFKGHTWTFLGNYQAKAKVNETIKWHKKHIKDWGVKKTFYTTTSHTIGNLGKKTYLLWYREGK